MAITRAKFNCNGVVFKGYSMEVTFNAVTADEVEENKRYHDATPSGSLWLNVTNKDLRSAFEVGTSYYLDIEEAPS